MNKPLTEKEPHMLYLITGGSASGKSEYAEKLATECYRWGEYDHLYYIATMYPYEEESVNRIQRHRYMRRDKGFHTIECCTDLSSLSFTLKDVLLIECMSNLLANEMYLKEGRIRQRGEAAIACATETIVEPLCHLEEMAGAVYVVTNEVFSDGRTYNEETDTYLRLLGSVNRQLAARAREVWEVVCGIPVKAR